MDLKPNEILELSEEELNKLSTEELEKYFDMCQYNEEFYHTQQLVEKIMINSLYGAVGKEFFPLFNLEMARAITGNGRFLVKNTANMIEERLQELNPHSGKYILYGDTDSAYYTIAPMMDKVIHFKPNLTMNEYVDIADKFEMDVVAPVINKSVEVACSKLNALKPDVIGAKREIIADSVIFVAKKKYIARIRDSEGTRYPEAKPHMKFMGVELARSQTSPFTKRKLLESLDILLDSDEDALRRWMELQRKEYYNSDINDIATYGTVSDINYNLSDKGIPFMCKGAIYFNNYINGHKLHAKYNLLSSGDKCRSIMLKQPNALGPTDRLVFSDPEFVEYFKDYIDYEESFQKFFVQPLQNMAKAMGYEMAKKVATYDEW